MPRPRKNDPLGTSDNPAAVTEPTRVEELITEFRRRLAYIWESYQLWRSALGNSVDFNRSVERLQQALARKRTSKQTLRRLHPGIECLVSARALCIARDRSGLLEPEILDEDLREAARLVAAEVKRVRGRPDDLVLSHHVEGLMALIQETSGKPVLPHRSKDNIYNPRLAEGVSQIIKTVFEDRAAGITEITLVYIVRDARRKFAGKPMRFSDFFPFYGASLDSASAELRLANGAILTELGANTPIYCP